MDYERAQTSDFLKGNPRFLEPNITANLAITDKFRAYAGDHGLPTAAAWLLRGYWQKVSRFCLFLVPARSVI